MWQFGTQTKSLLCFFGELAFDGDFHVANTFGVGDVRDACFAADVDPKFEGHFADFRDRHVLNALNV